MSLIDNKIAAFSNLIASLPILPNADGGLTADELQVYWDESPEELRQAINGVIDLLISLAGADNIGATALSGGFATTVQGIVEEVDVKAVSVINGLNTHKSSSDHDGRYFTKSELSDVLDGTSGADKIGLTPVADIPSNTVQSFAESIRTLIEEIEVVNANAEVVIARKGEPTLGDKIDVIDSQINDNAIKTTSVGVNSVGVSLPDDKLTLINKKLSMPDGFNWTGESINIYKSGLGVITTDFDVANFEPVGGVTYYVLRTGSDSNDGLTIGTPLANISTARAKSDVGTIILLDTDAIYRENNGFNNVNSSSPSAQKNISIKASEGSNVIITAGRNNLTFTKTGGLTNVYQTTRTLFVSVYDSLILDSDGDWTKLVSKPSTAEVDSNQGSYYYDTATSILYIHTCNSRVPDTNITTMLDVYNLNLSGQYTTYLENIKLYGGKDGCVSIGSTYSTNSRLYAKNCEFKFSSSGYGCAIATNAGAIFQNCKAAKGMLDGFSYHGSDVWAIEINCIGYKNGVVSGAFANNGSTLHDGGKGITINSEYYGNGGPNVHDIYTETQRWCIGGSSHSSATSTVARKSNYRTEQGAVTWLDSCVGYDTPSNNLYADATSKIYARNSLFSTDDVVLGTFDVY